MNSLGFTIFEKIQIYKKYKLSFFITILQKTFFSLQLYKLITKCVSLPTSQYLNLYSSFSFWWKKASSEVVFNDVIVLSVQIGANKKEEGEDRGKRGSYVWEKGGGGGGIRQKVVENIQHFFSESSATW